MEVIEASYTADAIDQDGIPFTLAGDLAFQMAEDYIEVSETVQLDRDYDKVNVVGNEIVVDLGGYTVQVLTVNGNNVTLMNGTIINLTISEGVENVTLEDISDSEDGTWIFAGGGSDSIIFKGRTSPKGTILITSPKPIGIRSDSEDSKITGNVIIKTLSRVKIDTPVQGGMEVRAAAESITVKSPVRKITVFFRTHIRIDHRISEDERPILEKPVDVDASAVLIDGDEDEIDDIDFQENEDLPTPENIIIGVEKIIVEVKPGTPYSLPAKVKAIYSDGTSEYKAVDWNPPAADTSNAGTFTFVGTVADYEGTAQLILKVKEDETIYNLIYTAGPNGSIQGNASQTVKHGQDGTEVLAVADPYHHFVKWSDGSTSNPRIDTNVIENIEVYAIFAIDKYIVTFVNWDGEILSKERVSHGSSATAPTAPAREGYTFTGWDEAFDNVTDDLIVTAQYSINQHTATFNSNGGSEVGAQTADFGTKLTKPDDPIKEGYTFAGWYKDDELANEWDFDTDVVTEDITLYAKWTINQYTITFDTGEGGSEIASITQDYGTAVTPPADPARDGYSFKGWSPEIPATMPAEDLTLVARWEAVIYSITYHLDGGTNHDANPGIYTIETETITLQPATKMGYTFVGWYDADNREVTGIPKGSMGDITLYAKWEPAPATRVELLIEDLPDVQDLTLDDLGNVEAAEAAYEGLTNEEKEMVDPSFVAKLNSAAEKITQLVLDDVDARFNQAKEELKYEGTGIDRVEYENRKATFYIDDPDKDVFSFVQSGVINLFQELFQDVVSMKLNNNHSYDIVSDPLGPYGAGARIVLALMGHEERIDNPTEYMSELMEAKMSQLQGKNVDIEATIRPGIKEYNGSYMVEFKGIEYTVTVDAPEGGVTGGGTYEIGSEVQVTVTPPEGKEIDTFRIDGVDKADELVDGKYTFIIKSDVTVDVTYSWKYYTVTFKDWNGTELKVETVKHGDPATAPADPVREGYTFTGWDATFDNVTGDLIVTAQYTPDSINDVWDGSREAFSLLDPSNPENSEDNPYVIDSSAKLAELAYQVNNGNNYSGKYLILNADLNLNDLPWTTIGYHDDWTDEETAFSGYFDGNNHTISGLKIDHEGYAGLFAAVSGGKIENFTLLNPVVTYDYSEWVGNIGVVAGVAERS
ncbi:MAG: InlB B-repeat-containing protein [Zhaonellaceae bacterium]